MNYGSVCSGIEAASVAWGPLGWTAQWLAEVEPFPSAVLAHHYPTVPNLGDITADDFLDRAEAVGSIELLVGGTPCQSFSVAGLRKGLADDRGNLALVYCQILARLRPQWCVWENVPGVLSSNGGRDFGAILGALADLGYGFAYRVLDAAFFGCAAPRARVFVVGHNGDWRPPTAVLFESTTLQGDSTPIPKTRMEGTRTLKSSNPLGRRDADPLIPCWWDGSQQAQTADAVLHKRQSIPEKNRFPALIDRANGLRWATPREWERMLGFPDNHTQIPWRGKDAADCPDSPRYKALGNSFATPVVRWIGERIAAL